MYTFGFIGVGHMGGALAQAAAKALPNNTICLAGRTREKVDALAKTLNCATGDNVTVARQSQYIFLGVKPQMLQGVLESIAPTLAARQDHFVLISMAAGVSLETLAAWSGGRYPIIRIQPNLPVSVGAGLVLYTPNEQITPADIDGFRAGMAQAGVVEESTEALADVACCVAGCGIAYICQVIQSMADGGVACGLPRDKALEYAITCTLGTAKLLQHTGQHPIALSDGVCSPGGTTIQGVRTLQQRAVPAAMLDAVIAAYEKGKKLV